MIRKSDGTSMDGHGGGDSGPMIPSRLFFGEYHGHKVEHLRVALPALREGRRSVIFLAGDSSLDNKYWFDDCLPAVNGYERLLAPPEQKADVAYWLNHELVRLGRGAQTFALNAAVRAALLCCPAARRGHT